MAKLETEINKKTLNNKSIINHLKIQIVMKKMFMVAMTLFVAMVTVMAAPPKNDEASIWKSSKKQAKELKREGWKVDGTRTMEEALYYFHLEEAKDPEQNKGYTERIQGTTSAKTINQAKQWAHNNAAISYAKRAGQFLRGRITAEISAGVNNPSLDNFYEAYESLVQKLIQNELNMKFGLYREKADKTIEYQAWYIINEDKASKARIRAMENMQKESEFAREHAKELSDFVRQGFKLEE